MTSIVPNQWRALVAAVVRMAVADATKSNPSYVYAPGPRERLRAEAQQWLLGEDAGALLQAIDLNAESLLDALTRPNGGAI